MKTKLWYWYYIIRLSLHELFCGTSLYTVNRSMGYTFVIHDACGKLWSA